MFRNALILLLLATGIAFYPHLKQQAQTGPATLISGAQLSTAVPSQRVAVFATVAEHYVTNTGTVVTKAQADDGTVLTWVIPANNSGRFETPLRVKRRYYAEGTASNGLLTLDHVDDVPASTQQFTTVYGTCYPMNRTRYGGTFGGIHLDGRYDVFASFENHLAGIPYTHMTANFVGYYDHNKNFVVREVQPIK